MVVLVMTALGALMLAYLLYQPAPAAAPEEPKPDPPQPPRNFTTEQLHASGAVP